MERKYLFEAGLNVFCSYKSLIPAEQLYMVDGNDHKYHIYFILSLPKMYFNHTKTKILDNYVTMSIFEPITKQEHTFNSSKLNGLNVSKYSISTSYPYDKLTITINDDDYLLSHPNQQRTTVLNANDIFTHNTKARALTYEVLYIGQAYGKSGERTAVNRLSSHSTLQRILADCQLKHSDKRIYILMLEMTASLFTSFDGISKQYTKSDEENTEHLNNVICNLPREEQIINITEAALINYFKPEYNQKFVDNFPNHNHLGYKQYFDLDYNCLTIELDMEFNYHPYLQLHSNANCINSYYEYIQYNLYNDPNRKNMYDIFKPMNN